MKFKKIILALIVVALVLVCASCNQNKLVGFDVELAEEFANELGVKVRFVEIIWESKEFELESKNIDLIWNGLTITDERKENLEISIPYLENRQVVVSKNFDAVPAGNYTVAFESTSVGDEVANSDEIFKNYKKVAVGSQTDALTEVLSGQSDFAIIDSVMAGYYINSDTSFKSLKILDYETVKEYYGIAARKGEAELISKLNEIISKLYESGKVAKIAEKYGLSDYMITPEVFGAAYPDGSLDYIKNKGEIVIGYTVFAPIAFFG